VNKQRLKMLVQFGSGIVWHGHAELYRSLLNQWFSRNINFKIAISTNGRLPCRLLLCRRQFRSAGALLHTLR